MKYAAAYLLLVLGGNEHPKVCDIASVLESAGIDVDEAQASRLVNAMAGKNAEEVIAAGQAKLCSMPAGGAVSAGGGGGGAAPAASEEKPKEEEKPAEDSDESDDDMGMGLFD